MKYFLKMIEEFNRHGVGACYDEKDAANPKVLEAQFIEMVSKARSFVFTPPTEDQQKVEPSRWDTIVGAPFPVFSIEITGERPMVGLGQADLLVNVYALLVAEVLPGEFVTFSLVKHKRWDVLFSKYALNGFVNKYIGRINKENSGLEIVNIKTKLGKGAQKRFHKINNVIHITNSPNIYTGNYSSREIDWSHRFEVRGHWRAKEGIGKDRAGNYCVEGFTWVSEHVRGPEELPLIKKQRIVTNSYKEEARRIE